MSPSAVEMLKERKMELTMRIEDTNIIFQRPINSCQNTLTRWVFGVSVEDGKAGQLNAFPL